MLSQLLEKGSFHNVFFSSKKVLKIIHTLILVILQVLYRATMKPVLSNVKYHKPYFACFLLFFNQIAELKNIKD